MDTPETSYNEFNPDLFDDLNAYAILSFEDDLTHNEIVDSVSLTSHEGLQGMSSTCTGVNDNAIRSQLV